MKKTIQSVSTRVLISRIDRIVRKYKSEKDEKLAVSYKTALHILFKEMSTRITTLPNGTSLRILGYWLFRSDFGNLYFEESQWSKGSWILLEEIFEVRV